MTSTPHHPIAAARVAEPSSMRWPIHLQLLVPMVSVVLLASLLATAITASWIALRVRIEQRESLRRVVKTLGEAAFPLTENVLAQMSGLSGAEFVLTTPQGGSKRARCRWSRRGWRISPGSPAHAATDDARRDRDFLGRSQLPGGFRRASPAARTSRSRPRCSSFIPKTN